MKLSLNWINDFVDIKDLEPNEIANGLIKAGFEVESIDNMGKGMERVFVGEITKLERHPNADKLQVCSIDVGFEKVQILTAATNVFEGALVPVALDGADLPNGVLIKTTNMRGLESQGMLCSGYELKIDNNVYDGAEIDGIMILHEDYKLGTPIADVLGLNDVVFDVTVLSNRPDCNSVLALAREISAIFDRPFKMPELDFVQDGEDAKNLIDVDINTDRCMRYMASVVKDLKICESPAIIKQRLNAVGIRSINNIVDITNYVLVEIGQPMHAFDFDKISDGVIEVRNAREGEEVLALNMEEYTLNKNDIVISDNKNALAIAGVMGGFRSAINSMSKNLLFESATFARESVRLTSKKLGLASDSSGRFEKGVEPAFCELGMKRALHLISKYNYGTICKGIVEDCLIDLKPKEMEIDLNYINKVLATKVTADEAKEILTKLDFKVEIISNAKLSVVVPIYRNDIECNNDIAEELIRIYGFDKIEPTLISDLSIFKPMKEDNILNNIAKIKNVLVNKGFNELNTFSLSSIDFIKKLRLENVGESDIISLSNPLNADLKYLRINMADSLLNVVANNNNRGNKQLKVFEVSRIYKKVVNGCVEENICSFAVTGKNLDFYKGKGIVELLSNIFNVSFNYTRSEISYLNNFKSAKILLNDECIGYLGFVHPQVLKDYGVVEDVILCELNIDKFISNSFILNKYVPYSKFPSVTRDLSFVVPKDLEYTQIVNEIKNSSSKYCNQIELIDKYVGQNIANGSIGLTFRLKFEKYDSTFTDDEIEKIVSKIIRSLQYKLNITLREN